MSNYNATLSITIPVTLRETGKRISRALDPDIGGYGAFEQYLDAAMQPCDEATGIYVTYSTPVTEPFLAQAEYMLATPAVLFYAVSQDYAARWAEYVPPTLEECQAFCAGVILPNAAE